MRTAACSISEMEGLWSVTASEILRNYAIVIGGAIGLAFAFWRGLAHSQQAGAQRRQAEVAQRVHTTDVFTTAVGLLREDKLEIRLGAVYSLKHIAANDQEFSDAILNLLQTYVRERTAGQLDAEPGEDIRAIMAILSERLAQK